MLPRLLATVLLCTAVPAMAESAGILIDRLEWLGNSNGNLQRLKSEAFVMRGANRLIFKADAEAQSWADTEAELQFLHGQMIADDVELQLGLRQDLSAGARRSHAAIVFDITPVADTSLAVEFYISHRAELTGHVEIAHQWTIAPRLLLEPTAELQWAARNVPARGLARGPTSLEAAVRLRYQIRPWLAPHIGISRLNAMGKTHHLVRESGDHPGQWLFILGWHGEF